LGKKCTTTTTKTKTTTIITFFDDSQEKTLKGLETASAGLGKSEMYPTHTFQIED
jgi:hypothetical protein